MSCPEDENMPGVEYEQLVLLPAVAYKPHDDPKQAITNSFEQKVVMVRRREEGSPERKERKEQIKIEELELLPAVAYRPHDDPKQAVSNSFKPRIVRVEVQVEGGEDEDEDEEKPGWYSIDAAAAGLALSPGTPTWPYPLFDPRGCHAGRNSLATMSTTSTSTSTERNFEPIVDVSEQKLRFDVEGVKRISLQEIRDAVRIDPAGLRIEITPSRDEVSSSSSLEIEEEHFELLVDAVQTAPDRLLFRFAPDEVEGWWDKTHDEVDELEATEGSSGPHSPAVEQAKSFTEDSAIEPGSTASVLDEETVAGTGQPDPMKETVSKDPIGIDTSILERIRQGGSDRSSETMGDSQQPEFEDGSPHDDASIQPPLARHIDDLKAIEILLTHRQKKWNVDDSGLFPQTGGLSQHLQTYRDLLRKLLRHNVAHPEPTDESAKSLLSNHIITSLWIRERMQVKWNVNKHQNTAARKILQSRRAAAALGDDDVVMTEEFKAIAKEERTMARKLFESCVLDELRDIEGALVSELDTGVSELRELFALRNALRLELLEGEPSLAQMVEVVADSNKTSSNIDAPVVSSFPYLMDQIEALSSLIDVGLHTTASLETRLNRMAAKDVTTSEEERQQVSEQRLAEPEALIYLQKSEEDLRFVQDWSRTVIAGFRGVEAELGTLSRNVGDWQSGLKECLIAMERRAEQGKRGGDSDASLA